MKHEYAYITSSSNSVFVPATCRGMFLVVHLTNELVDKLKPDISRLDADLLCWHHSGGYVPTDPQGNGARLACTLMGMLRCSTNEQNRKDAHSADEGRTYNLVAVEFDCLYRWHATGGGPLGPG